MNRIPRPASLVLIGGGDTMIHAARSALARHLRVTVILAPRHADERLPLGGEVTLRAFQGLGVPVLVFEDINAEPLAANDWTGSEALALCFGPAWIFSDGVLAAFGAGMINYNPIPVPRYLGGAHYSWQILNGDREGGAVLQLITRELDRGPILRARYFRIPDEARTPADYFAAYHAHGCELLDATLDDIVAGRPFEQKAFAEVDAHRLYLPRLHTLHNAFIDWQWSGREIERFCCAFDEPYMGAATFVQGVEVRLSDVRLESGAEFHPFVSGLIIRRRGGHSWAATRDGLLRIGAVRTVRGEDAGALLREGRRLATPPQKLYEAKTYRPKLSGKGIG
jgi:methionyl-tRNA formyltransferase